MNIVLQHAARRQDKADARRILSLMRQRNLMPDSYTLAAIGRLKTPLAPSNALSANSSGAAAVMDELDAWLKQLCKSQGAVSGASVVGSFNQVCSVHPLALGTP